MAVPEWAVVLPVCEHPSKTSLVTPWCVRLLVGLLDIQVQVEPPPSPLHVCLQEHLQVATLPELQAGHHGATIGIGYPMSGMRCLQSHPPNRHSRA